MLFMLYWAAFVWWLEREVVISGVKVVWDRAYPFLELRCVVGRAVDCGLLNIDWWLFELIALAIVLLLQGLRSSGALADLRVRHAEFSARFLAFYD